MLRKALLGAAAQPKLRRLAETTAAARQVARRFVAGETMDDGLEAARALNRRGFKVSLDHLGEHVSRPEEAERAADLYVRLLEAIAERKLDANVSLKLTQFGIDLNEGACERLLTRVVERAARLGSFVRIDMESSAYTERTLALFARMHERFPGYVGPVIQSYLYRSEADVRALIRLGARVRLCKGAYAEPPSVAYPDKADVNRAYVQLMEQLMLLGTYPGIATHDARIVDHARRFAERWEIGRERFEFQMLYGIRRDVQDELVRDGWNVRIYVPFGGAWYPYLTRRLAERPANLRFVLES
ncbi:MAG TPA: proline dehydrogenase family protein, partial [Chloroflexota bacterium]|nr:proline dehydrogenase family protein [Chloroflexota bacterium]